LRKQNLNYKKAFMKKNLGMFFGLPSLGMGAALLALCAFTSVSRADVTIIDNLADSTDLHALEAGNPLAQVFTVSADSGNISSLTLGLYIYSVGGGGSATATIDLYSATSGGAPFGSALATLGTVSTTSSGSQQLAVNPVDAYSLTAGTYAIVLETPTAGSIGLDATLQTSDSGGTATSPLGGIYYYDGSWTSADSGFYGQMTLTAVPEVPMTGMVMGFGVLAIALGHTLRRNLRSAV
jgi:hypothetical protein